MASKKSVVALRNKEGRGILLTGFLILLSLSIAYNLYNALGYFISHADNWSVYHKYAIELITLSGIILMWNWKKLGLYLYAASFLLSLFLTRASLTYYVYLIIISAVTALVFYTVLRPKWHLFK